MAEEQLVEIRHQRRALPAGRHVARTEVAHHGKPGQLGDDGRLTELQRGRLCARGDVPHRLAVAADQVDLIERQAGSGRHLLGGISECLAQPDIQRAQAVDGAGLRPKGAEDLGAQIGRVRHVAMSQQLPPQGRRRALDADDRARGAIRRCARDETNYDHDDLADE